MVKPNANAHSVAFVERIKGWRRRPWQRWNCETRTSCFRLRNSEMRSTEPPPVEYAWAWTLSADWPRPYWRQLSAGHHYSLESTFPAPCTWSWTGRTLSGIESTVNDNNITWSYSHTGHQARARGPQKTIWADQGILKWVASEALEEGGSPASVGFWGPRENPGRESDSLPHKPKKSVKLVYSKNLIFSSKSIQ